jgi:hypothetical protein
MVRVALLLACLGACTVGEVPPGGGNVMPDAPRGGGQIDAPGGGGQMDAPAAASGLTITATTQPTATGTFAPNHVVAVWIQDSGGAFVKTIDRWAATRKSDLVGWIAKAGSADADAVSGATIQSHATPLTITWDLKNKSGTVVPDGTYTIRMELADSNTTSTANNNEGTFTFVKGSAPQTQSALSNGKFTNVTIDFKP